MKRFALTLLVLAWLLPAQCLATTPYDKATLFGTFGVPKDIAITYGWEGSSFMIYGEGFDREKLDLDVHFFPSDGEGYAYFWPHNDDDRMYKMFFLPGVYDGQLFFIWGQMEWYSLDGPDIGMTYIWPIMHLLSRSFMSFKPFWLNFEI